MRLIRNMHRRLTWFLDDYKIYRFVYSFLRYQFTGIKTVWWSCDYKVVSLGPANLTVYIEKQNE